MFHTSKLVKSYQIGVSPNTGRFARDIPPLFIFAQSWHFSNVMTRRNEPAIRRNASRAKSHRLRLTFSPKFIVACVTPVVMLMLFPCCLFVLYVCLVCLCYLIGICVVSPGVMLMLFLCCLCVAYDFVFSLIHWFLYRFPQWLC